HPADMYALSLHDALPICSTGQEVYSLMVLLDHLNLLDKADIYATDISRNAIENAKKGVFRYSFNYINYNMNFKAVFGENDAPDLDRKSTRLNSSHVKISY